MSRPAEPQPDRNQREADAASLVELRALFAQMTEAEQAELLAFIDRIIAERGAK